LAPPYAFEWAHSGWQLSRIVTQAAEKRRNQERNRQHWSTEICDPASDPWNYFKENFRDDDDRSEY
jgi:hypothetical protein